MCSYNTGILQELLHVFNDFNVFVLGRASRLPGCLGIGNRPAVCICVHMDILMCMCGNIYIHLADLVNGMASRRVVVSHSLN